MNGEPVTILDYGAGNLASLTAAFRRQGWPVRVVADPDAVARARRLVLPGVGAAPPALAELRRGGLDSALRAALEAGGSLFGICLGMQLLFERSDEGDAECLGLIGGRCARIGWSARLPHMGWNDVAATRPHPLAAPLPAVCYFAHSFAVEPARADVVIGETELDGRRFPCLVAEGPVAGVQFHPEKSGPAGRRLLDAYEAWTDAA